VNPPPVIVERGELDRVVQLLTGSDETGPWQCDKIHDAVPSATLGIWRVHGDGWSVVLKLVGLRAGGHPHWQAGSEADHWYYWRREAAAYESGLLGSFAGGLRAPACHLVADRPDATTALWLEDLTPLQPASEWSLARYGAAARHLGQAQGAFAVGRRLPQDPWLSRDWLRSYLAQRGDDMVLLEDPDVWANPLVRQWLSPELAKPLLEMRRDQPTMLAVLDRSPRTLCHLDLHPANLFGADDHTALIDWSFVGIGALAEDVGNLVPDAVLDFHVPAADIDDLFDTVLEGYAIGARDSGASVTDADVELAMLATITAKYAWIAPAMLRAAIDGAESLNRRPIADVFPAWAPVIPFFTRCARRARRRTGEGS
jgi:hypothetical protein